jgi:hypothetical protein
LREALLKVPITIFGLQVGTLTFADIIIQVGTFIIAYIFFIQVGTLKFVDISLQIGRSALSIIKVPT